MTQDALNTPIEEIVWGKPKTPGPRFSPAFLAVASVAVASIGVGVATAYGAAREPRLAPNQACDHVTVKPGDNVWTIGKNAGVTLDVIARLNPQVPNLSVVFEGDQIVTSCEVNEVQKIVSPTGLRSGVATYEQVLRALWDAGARGHQLITLAAITEGESGRRVDALGDVDIATGKWGPSGGAFQVRSVRAERGKGTTRDLDRVLTLEGGARSAVELWNQAQDRGQDPGSPWTAYLRGYHIGMMPTYEALAKQLGMLS